LPRREEPCATRADARLQYEDHGDPDNVIEERDGGAGLRAPDPREAEMTATLRGTKLETDRVVPGTPLVLASSGARVSLWELRQRFAAAVCFLHERCEPCADFARKLARSERELREADAIALAVVSEAADLELPVWIDEDARARESFLDRNTELPLVLIVDRYGAAARSFPSRGHAFPPPEAIVATLWHIAMQCPECGVSEW
jgi:hypothetical protein